MNFNSNRVLEWLHSENRKPPAFAFTAGVEREVADLIEEVERPLQRRIAELERNAARWNFLSRIAERFKGATGATFWEIQPLQGETIEGAVDEAIAERKDGDG